MVSIDSGLVCLGRSHDASTSQWGVSGLAAVRGSIIAAAIAIGVLYLALRAAAAHPTEVTAVEHAREVGAESITVRGMPGLNRSIQKRAVRRNNLRLKNTTINMTVLAHDRVTDHLQLQEIDETQSRQRKVPSEPLKLRPTPKV